MHSRRLPSFFLTKRTGAPQGDLLGQMKLFLVFSSRKFLSVASLGGNKEWTGLWKGLVPSSRLIFKSYGLWGAKMFAFSPENTLWNSRYSLSMVSGKVSVSTTITDLALRFSLPVCMSGLYWCVPREIMNVAFSGFLHSLDGSGTYPVDVHPCGGGWHRFWCHWSLEGDLCFHPVDDQVVVGQPVISEYHQVFFIQLGYIELDNM